VRGIVKFFSSSFSPLPLRERLRVRGIFFQFFSPLAGENKSEGCR